MKKKYLILFVFLILILSQIQAYQYPHSRLEDAYAASSPTPPKKEWAKEYLFRYSHERSDGAYSVIQTSDGGYALAGQTSNIGDNNGDFWLVKTDSKGQMIWNTTYGLAGVESARCVIQTMDKGYAIVGITLSGGDNNKILLIKTDAAGKMEWNQTYRGYRYNPQPGWFYGVDSASQIIQLDNGEYVIVGDTGVNEGTGGIRQDGWLLKVDSRGKLVWNHTYGGHKYDFLYSLTETNDGGFALAGSIGSEGQGEGVGGDFWLVKVDSNGIFEWNQTYPGSGDSRASTVVQLDDGGYMLSGFTNSKGAGGNDFWLVKTTSSGKMVWDMTYGGSGYDAATAMVKVDEGFILTGVTTSFGKGSFVGWIVKTDLAGEMQWNQTVTSRGTTMIKSMVKINEDEFAIAGLTQSSSEVNFYLAKFIPEIPSNTGGAPGGNSEGTSQGIPFFSAEIIFSGILLSIFLFKRMQARVTGPTMKMLKESCVIVVDIDGNKYRTIKIGNQT